MNKKNLDRFGAIITLVAAILVTISSVKVIQTKKVYTALQQEISEAVEIQGKVLEKIEQATKRNEELFEKSEQATKRSEELFEKSEQKVEQTEEILKIHTEALDRNTVAYEKLIQLLEDLIQD